MHKAIIHKMVYTHHIEAIEVVQVAVLPGTMHCILVHGDLWAVEDRRLIHVVPCVEVLHGTLRSGQRS